ncbi:MAG: FtsL-like putative cell division protein [Bacteroidia bacterium]
MNKFKEKPKENKAKDTNQAISGVFKLLSDIVTGNILTRESVVKTVPYFLFLSFLAIIYISNGYYAEDTVRALNNVNNELKELSSEYISTKSELMFRSKQSEVARALEPYGIKESVTPPKKIVVNKKDKE